MTTPKAKRTDWQTKPMERGKAPVLLARTFDAAQTARIEAGVLPREMEDKWFVFEEEGRVFLHRSWTGNAIYEIALEPAGNGRRIAEAWVTADRGVYAREGHDDEARALSRILDMVVLGGELDSPARFEAAPLKERIWVWQGDLTTLAVDAIVNAANETLLGGGGVDGAIHRAAGPKLLAECRTLGGCKTGDAKITRGHALPAAHVIHTVGPVWYGGAQSERARLASCYQKSLSIAAAAGLRTVAFPGISTGVYGYPVEKAAKVAAETTLAFLARDPRVSLVVFCTFGADATLAARSAIAAHLDS